MFTNFKRVNYLKKFGIEILKGTEHPSFSWNGIKINVPSNLDNGLRIYVHRECQRMVTNDQLIQLQGWLNSYDETGHHTNLNLIKEMSWRS